MQKIVIKSNNASNEKFMFRSIWNYTHFTFLKFNKKTVKNKRKKCLGLPSLKIKIK